MTRPADGSCEAPGRVAGRLAIWLPCAGRVAGRVLALFGYELRCAGRVLALFGYELRCAGRVLALFGYELRCEEDRVDDEREPELTREELLLGRE